MTAPDHDENLDDVRDGILDEIPEETLDGVIEETGEIPEGALGGTRRQRSTLWSKTSRLASPKPKSV